MEKSRRQLVRERARDYCEYCQLPQTCTLLPHEVDHIRSKKHRGPTILHNLCWACAACNSSKGANAAGYDNKTGRLVRLFNPRRDRWENHFAWHGPTLVGLTAIGRATIDVLNINQPEREEFRQTLIALGLFPPREIERNSKGT
jgi:hypothetical protein